MVKLNGLFVIFLVSLLLFTGCKNPVTSSDILPKDWSNASIVDKITADDGTASRFFGSAAAISGDTAIVGAYFDNEKGASSGSVYIFEKESGVWTQAQKLTAGDGAAGDWFGYSVAISGDTAIVGAFNDDDMGSNSGSVYIFQRDSFNGLWYQAHKFSAADGAADDNFGRSVAISGDTAIVGSYRDDDKGTDSGSVYIFHRVAGLWSQFQKLTAGDGNAGDLLGLSVSISGDMAIVGAYGDDDQGTYSGAAYIFRRDSFNGIWYQVQKLTAADGAADDFFGISVSITGSTAIVGVNYDDDMGTDSGSAYIFQRDAGVWTQAQKITAGDGAAGDFFGYSVAVSGDMAIVGAYVDDDKGTDSGSVYIFQRAAGAWIQVQKLTAYDGAADDWFGRPVAISGDTVIVGAYFDDDKGTNSGSVYFIE